MQQLIIVAGGCVCGATVRGCLKRQLIDDNQLLPSHGGALVAGK
jgi:hypothetical protein